MDLKMVDASEIPRRPFEEHEFTDWLTVFLATRPTSLHAIEVLNEAILELGTEPSELRARVLTELGRNYRELGQSGPSIKALEEAGGIYAAKNNVRDRAECLVEIGRTYSRQGEVAEALIAYEIALPLLLPDGDQELIRRIEIGIGHIYILMDETDEALRTLQSALGRAREMHDFTKVATALNNLAYVHLKRNDPDSARICVEEAIATFDPNSPVSFEATMWHTYGETLFECGRVEEASKIFLEAKAKADAVGDVTTQAQCLVGVVRSEIALGRTRPELSNLLAEAKEVSANTDSERIKNSIVRAEIEWFAASNRFEEAFRLQSEAISQDRSSDDFQLRRRLAIWNRRYERYREEAKDTHDQFLRQLTQSVPGVLYRWQRSPSGRSEYTYVSSGAYDVLGISAEQLEQDSSLLRVHPSDQQRFASSLEEAIQAGRDWNFEGRFVLANGREALLRNDSRLSTSEDGFAVAYGFLRDITEEREIQEALRQTERRFQEAIEAGFDGLILMDPVYSEQRILVDMIVAEINARAEEFVSRRRDVARNAGIRQWLKRRLWMRAEPIFRKVLETGQPHTEELRLELEWFQPEWAELQFFRVGKSVAITIRDTTARHLLLDQLRASEERWQLAIEGSQDGIWDNDLLHHRTFVSDRWYEMLGVTPMADLQPRELFDMRMHPEDRYRFSVAYQRHLRGETPIYSCEFRLRHNDGAYRWIMARGKATRDERGHPVRIVGTHTDVTDAKRLETLLRAIAEANRRLIDADSFENVLSIVLRDIVMAMDLGAASLGQVNRTDSDVRIAVRHESVQHPPLVRLDTIWESQFSDWRSRLSNNEVINIGEEDGRSDHTILSDSGLTGILILPIYAESGLWGCLILENTASPRPFGDAEVAMLRSLAANIGLAIDQRSSRDQLVTTNRDLQIAVQTAQELAIQATAASQAKSEFVANMSHEIRTPMNGVLGLIDLLIETGLTPQQVEFALGIRHSGDSLLTIINDILDFSKMEAGKLSLESVVFDPISVARDVAALMRPQTERKGLELHFECRADGDGRTTGDPVRFRQILTNLMGNAVKFTPRGAISLRVDVRSSGITIEVEDTGIGTANDRMSDIWKSFHQADNSVTRVYGGTGLGLTITRRLTLLINGDISVESVPGEGTKFTVKLPYRSPAEATQTITSTAASSDRPSLENKRILICEDNPINELMVTRILQGIGAQFSIARDGEQAVAAAMQQEFDLVLMDVQMPNMDGLTAARLIRNGEAGTGRRVPIIAVTAGATQHDLREILEAGMDERVSKPFRPEKLRALLYQRLFEPNLVESARELTS
jgi:PAS domain S-box-containing protein